jgi:hypothetical protein
MPRTILLLLVLAAICYYYLNTRQPLPQTPKTAEVVPQNTPHKVKGLSHDISTVQPNQPTLEALDSNWFARLINDTSKACLLALSSENNDFQDIQNQISNLRDAANKSKTLLPHLDLRAQILRLYGRINFAYNELLQYRKRFKDIDNQNPTSLDAYKTSIVEWREKRKKRMEAEWSTRKRAIETELNNLTIELVALSKSKNLAFDKNDAFATAAENFKNTAQNIKSSHEQAEAARELAKRAKFHDIEVTQVLPNGILADPLESVNKSSFLTRVGGGGTGVYSYHLSGRTVYVDGLSGMAEGQRVLISYIENGVFNFVDTNGASRTVPKWRYIRTEEKNN